MPYIDKNSDMFFKLEEARRAKKLAQDYTEPEPQKSSVWDKFGLLCCVVLMGVALWNVFFGG